MKLGKHRFSIVLIVFFVFDVFKLFLGNVVLVDYLSSSQNVLNYTSFILPFCILFFYPAVVFRLRTVFLLFYFAQTLFILVNIGYYLTFKSYLYIPQALFGFSIIESLFRNHSVPWYWEYFIAAMDLPVVIWLMVLWNDRKPDPVHANIIWHAVIVGTGLVFFVVNLFGVPDPNTCKKDPFSGETSVICNYGVLTLTLTDFLDKGIEEKNYLAELNISTNLVCEKGDGARRNIILIQVESLGANTIEVNFAGKPVMPYLRSLISNEIFYPYVLSYHKGGGTSDCEFCVLNSQESLDGFPVMRLKNYPYSNSIVKKFSCAGYKTLAIHGNSGTYWNRTDAFARMGYSEFADKSATRRKSEKLWGILDSDIFDYALNRIRNEKGNYFYHIITLSSHLPFTQPDRVFHNPDFDTIDHEPTRKYFNSMSYVDTCIRNFVTSLPDRTNTVILIYGDHVAPLESPLYRLAYDQYDNRNFEYVPLFILAPGQLPRIETKKAASFLDLAPSLLHLSGISYEIRTYGENLTSPESLRATIHFREGSYGRESLFKNALSTSRPR